MVAIALTGALTASPVSGQNLPEPEGYKSVIAVAVSEFDQGNFAEARECFLRAHALLPNARTLRGLGKSEFELRNYLEAARYLEQALQHSSRRLEGQLREDTDELLARTKTYLGAVRLHLNPRTMTVRVDGLSLQDDPRKPIQLTVGDHTLDFHAVGHLDEKRAIKIRGEKTIDLYVNMDEPARSGPASDSGSSAAPTPTIGAGGSGHPSRLSSLAAWSLRCWSRGRPRNTRIRSSRTTRPRTAAFRHCGATDALDYSVRGSRLGAERVHPDRAHSSVDADPAPHLLR